MVIQIAAGILLAVFALHSFNKLWAARKEIAWKVIEWSIYFSFVSLLLFLGLAAPHMNIDNGIVLVFLIIGLAALFIIGPRLDDEWWNHKTPISSSSLPLAKR
ncbi:hypothetical protein KW786_03785 [Candidatus Parcubacteria bacterium]|nr:hypothetical protein [Candidatus Parcubacteria bacterium]